MSAELSHRHSRLSTPAPQRRFGRESHVIVGGLDHCCLFWSFACLGCGCNETIPRKALCWSLFCRSSVTEQPDPFRDPAAGPEWRHMVDHPNLKDPWIHCRSGCRLEVELAFPASPILIGGVVGRGLSRFRPGLDHKIAQGLVITSLNLLALGRLDGDGLGTKMSKSPPRLPPQGVSASPLCDSNKLWPSAIISGWTRRPHPIPHYLQLFPCPLE